MYFIAKSPSRGFWMLMYLSLVPRVSSPRSKSSSSSKLKVRAIPEKFRKVEMKAEHLSEKTSISPLCVMMSAPAGWQTKEEGLIGSERRYH